MEVKHGKNVELKYMNKNKPVDSKGAKRHCPLFSERRE